VRRSQIQGRDLFGEQPGGVMAELSQQESHAVATLGIRR
jgi:hypothetical protein